MKRILQAISIIMAIIFANTANAQNFGVNSPTPNTSAALEVKSYPGLNQGVLIPSIALTSATDATTIPTPPATLLVYNTGTGGLTPAGYFYNAGTSGSPNWVRMLPIQGTGSTGQVPTSSGTGTPTWAGPGKLSNIVTYTSGSGTYTVPSGVTAILVKIVGGGGAGGSANYSGCSGSYHSASGGGSGAYCENFYVSPATTYSYSVGTGGTANTTTCGSSGGSGGSGGNTTFGSLSAGGGAGGRNSYDGFITAGGAGGTASGAQINISGARGGGATSTSYISSGYGANSIFGSGAPGTSPAKATNGNNGGTGSAGHCDNNGNPSGVGAGGAAVGSGTRLGGAGGNGGRGSSNNSSNNADGVSGSPGGGGAAAGTANGAKGANGGSGTDCNRDGRKGQNGTAGTSGTDASTSIPAVNSTFGSYWIPNGASASGTDGQGGGGGKGGGGGGRQSCTLCDDGPGSSGGGGGSGGEGGLAGTGGFGGGGCFGIYRNNSATGATLSEVVITISTASVGGAGGTGGAGGDGGIGGCGDGSRCNENETGGNVITGGRVCGNCEVGAGGRGGYGGAGGKGGNGQPGAPGRSEYMVTDNTLSNPSTSVTNPSDVLIDFATKRNNITGRACKYSQVDLSAGTVGAGWSFPSGLNYLDTTSFGASYNSGQSTISVTTDNSGLFNLGINSGTLQNFLYVVPDSRTLPVISPNTPSVCQGQSQTFTISNSYDVGNISEREWMLYKRSGISGQTLTYVASGNSTAFTYTYTTLDSFVLRYRERHTCCGWSRPVFQQFKAVDAPNAPTAVAISGGPYCYTGSGQSFTITTTGTIKYSGIDQWYLYDQDPAFGTPTAITNNATGIFTVTPTQTTTYWVRGENQCNQSSTLSVLADINGDPTTSGVLASVTSSMTCVVSGTVWHYFRNSSGEVIAAINSNGNNLGNVTLAVTVDADPNEHPSGGLGHAAMCNGTNELSLRRWYTVTIANTPSSGNTNFRFFFTAADYANYATAIANKISLGYPYQNCYGITTNVADLAVSRNESIDLLSPSIQSTGGPSSSVQYEYALSPGNLRLSGGTQANLISSGPTTFRWHTFGGIGEPLPVELVSFTGYNQKDQNVLNWVTASEKDVDKFEVEKSIDGLSDWSYIGWQKAVGGNVQKAYTFSDNQPVVGNNYYRLKIIDKDGTFTYSQKINIPISEALVNGFVKIFPNPTSGTVNLQLQSTKSSITTIEITNVLGQVVESREATLSIGVTPVTLDISHLPSGTYFVSFVDALGTKHQEKLIKQ